MALTVCEDCGKIYSNKNQQCPKCGHRRQINYDTKEHNKQRKTTNNINPKHVCPTCGSTDIRKLKFSEKLFEVMNLNSENARIRKCNECGGMW